MSKDKENGEGQGGKQDCPSDEQNQLTQKWAETIKEYRHGDLSIIEIMQTLHLSEAHARAMLGAFDILFADHVAPPLNLFQTQEYETVKIHRGNVVPVPHLVIPLAAPGSYIKLDSEDPAKATRFITMMLDPEGQPLGMVHSSLIKINVKIEPDASAWEGPTKSTPLEDFNRIKELSRQFSKPISEWPDREEFSAMISGRPAEDHIKIWNEITELIEEMGHIEPGGEIRIGVDVARFANQKTTFAISRNDKTLGLFDFPSETQMQTVALVKAVSVEAGRAFDIHPLRIQVNIIDSSIGKIVWAYRDKFNWSLVHREETNA